jgi:protein tyrosine phosphatase (PTP) superfamily phosphohydrolase (DUF442 family)
LDIKTLILQFAFLYAPLLHSPMQQVTPTLFRGLDPRLNEIRALHDKGFKTIISMRTNGQAKKARLCKELGMNWVWIKTGVFHSPTEDQFDRFRSVVNDPKQQPIYASCEVNMDRTGVYIAAYRMVDQHWTAEQIHEEFRQNHQKRWWPAFRKYQSVVVAYAAKKQKETELNNTRLNNTQGSSPDVSGMREIKTNRATAAAAPNVKKVTLYLK